MKTLRLWAFGSSVFAAGLLALPNGEIAANTLSNCPFHGCRPDNECVSEAFLISFCRDFMGCPTPYWCFQNVAECDGNAQVVCAGSET
jgi:hypothetical protein